MKYNPQDLKATYEENADGLTPEEFLKDRTKLYLLNLLETDENGTFYKQTGPYWETFYEVLKKYAPFQLDAYERRAGKFTYFDERVRAEYDYKDDLLNFMAALAYQGMRYDTMQNPDEVHLIELGEEDDYAYMPNQSIDQDQYFGRGDFFD